MSIKEIPLCIVYKVFNLITYDFCSFIEEKSLLLNSLRIMCLYIHICIINVYKFQYLPQYLGDIVKGQYEI